MTEFTKFIVWTLVVYGAVNGIVFSALLRPIVDWFRKKAKFLDKLLSCPMCVGFWMGMLASLTVYSPSGNFVADAFLGSCTSWIIFLLIKDKQFNAS